MRAELYVNLILSLFTIKQVEAAELGSIQALYHLGVLYHYGEDVQQDLTKAAEFYAEAAVHGHVQGRHNLGAI